MWFELLLTSVLVVKIKLLSVFTIVPWSGRSSTPVETGGESDIGASKYAFGPMVQNFACVKSKS
jgi:hypothetical protein